MTEDDLYVSPLEFYGSQGIKLRLGQRVVDLNLRTREIILDHKEVLRFNGLIIAVGGRPRIPEPLMVFEDLMSTLKTITDARRWSRELTEVESVLMIGGDLTSFGMTNALLHMGKQVSFILNEDAFWPVRYTREVHEEAAHKLSQRGVKVLEGGKLRSLARLSEHSLQVQVDNEKFSVGMVGAFFGLVPDVGFLARSGLQIERGVLVDEYLGTGFEGVYAAGDCAQVYHPLIRDYWVSIGHDNAVNLGHIAASNLAGDRIQADIEPEDIFSVEGIRANTSWWVEF
jgi:NAD(P)H-nitrite reductase large subunit